MSDTLMSERYPRAAAKYEPAMTFEEIAKELGISKQLAYFFFVSGLKKLRRNWRMKQLHALSESKGGAR